MSEQFLEAPVSTQAEQHFQASQGLLQGLQSGSGRGDGSCAPRLGRRPKEQSRLRRARRLLKTPRGGKNGWGQVRAWAHSQILTLSRHSQAHARHQGGAGNLEGAHSQTGPLQSGCNSRRNPAPAGGVFSTLSLSSFALQPGRGAEAVAGVLPGCQANNSLHFLLITGHSS